MKGFIYAAGMGTRLRPLTWKKPKPLLPIDNIPVICYCLAHLKSYGIFDITMNIHHLPGKLKAFFSQYDNFQAKISYSTETELLGTGGGLKKCRLELAGSDFIITNSDVVSDIDLKALCAVHDKNDNLATIVLYRTVDAGKIGPVAVKEDRVIDFKNFLKSNVPSDLIYTGTAVLSPGIFNLLQSGFSSIVYTAYTDLVKAGKIGYYIHQGLWLDMGSSITGYWAANIQKGQIWHKAVPYLKNITEKNLGLEMTEISARAKIHDCAALDNCIVADQAIINEKVKLKNCLVLPGAHVEPHSKFEDAIIDQDTIILVKKLK